MALPLPVIFPCPNRIGIIDNIVRKPLQNQDRSLIGCKLQIGIHLYSLLMKCPSQPGLPTVQHVRNIVGLIASTAQASTPCMVGNAECRKCHHQLFNFRTAPCSSKPRNKTALTFPQQNQIFHVNISLPDRKVFHGKQVLHLCQDSHFRALPITFQRLVLRLSPAAAKAEAECHIASFRKTPAPVLHACIVAQESVAGNDRRIFPILVKLFRKILHPPNCQTVSDTCKLFCCYAHKNPFPLEFFIFILTTDKVYRESRANRIHKVTYFLSKKLLYKILIKV